MADQRTLIAVVTGASRGIGKGIAIELGRKGATVFVVGRSAVSGHHRTPGGRPAPGTIHEAAAEVTAAGGKGIAVACDLSNDDEIRDLFARVERETGSLDILVNNAAALHEDMGRRPFWEAPIELADIISVGLRCHHIATYYAAPLLVASGRGLIVNISFYSNAKAHDPAYYAAKAGLDQLASSYADDFAPYDVAALSLWPGFTRTERAVDQLDGRTEPVSEKGVESVSFAGRVIGALWDDPALMSLTGKTVIAAEMAERYGIDDKPGFAPKSLRIHFGSPHPRFDIT